MESFLAQLFIAVSYVSKDAVVQSLEAPKHRLVTSVGHVRDQNFTCSDLCTGPHSSNTICPTDKIFLLFKIRHAQWKMK